MTNSSSKEMLASWIDELGEKKAKLDKKLEGLQEEYRVHRFRSKVLGQGEFSRLAPPYELKCERLETEIQETEKEARDLNGLIRYLSVFGNVLV